MEFFDRLGDLVSSRWRQKNYNEESFPEIAHAALMELPPHEHVSLWDVVKWGVVSDELPYQADLRADFGDPPLTIYAGRGFRIEALFWAEGVPSIHQHGFSGAFHVLHGSSIHSLWEFRARERIEMRLVLGDVTFKSAEMLVKGDSRRILAGQKMFHATYHMERPSVTIVVRTLGEEDNFPQYTLLPPAIASAPLNEIPSVKRQAQLLRMLLVSNRRSEYQDLIRYVVETRDAYSVFLFLTSTFNMIEGEEEKQDVLSTARLRHPSLIDGLEPALQYQYVGNKIIQMYRSVKIADLKFFLALLRNVPDRATILQFVSQRYPSRDAIQAVVAWVKQLSDLEALGIKFQKPWLLLLEDILSNRSKDEIRTSVKWRCSEFGELSTTEVADLEENVRSCWFLRSMLAS